MISAIHGNGLPIMVLFFAGIVVYGIWTGVNGNRYRRDRVFELQELATRLSFDEFNPGRDESFAMGWGFLSALARGNDRYAFNILRGKYQEQSLFIFDYHFETGSGEEKTKHELTMLMLVFKEIFPQLTIGPERLGARMAAALGIGDDIQFESAEFSRTFCVRSQDKKFAYDVCNPQMIEYLLANRDLHVEIQGPVVLLSFEPQLQVGRIEFELQRLVEIHSRLPKYLFTQNA